VKLLIGSPAFGGQVTCGYLKSLIPALDGLSSRGIQVDLHMPETESLIPRGRDTVATRALTKGYDKLLFIDADMIFTFENLMKLLESKRDIVGGTYPLKSYPITINFNPLPEHRDLFGVDRQQDNYLAWVAKYADENGEAEVMHLPTGFMLIDCKVLAALTYKVPWYQAYEADTKTITTSYEFFPAGVTDNQYESEDWNFCSIARENGFKVYLQTQAVNGHIGTHVYRLGSHMIAGQQPVIPSGKVRTKA
jgi:hypothetical protein